MTTAPKSRYLQSLSNIDLAHRNKKVITTPTRPPAPAQSRVSKDAPVEVLFAKPVVAVEPVEPKPAHVRRIYDRDFLLKFKYAFTDFPAGVPTPEEVVVQYNKDMEIRDARERQALSGSSSLSVRSKPKPSSFEAQEKKGLSAGATTTALKERREKKTNGEVKLRIPASKVNLSKLPMFSPKPDTVQSSSTQAAVLDNKENSVLVPKINTAPVVVPTKKPKIVSVIPPAVQTVPQTFVDLVKKENKPPNVVAVAETKPEPANIVLSVAVPVVEETPVVDPALDELTKKMKAVLTKEDDPRRLAQRQKQIDYGKNTVGYSNYVTSVAKSKRKRDDPKTPNKHQICSKRSWDGQIRKWRRMLHFYDPKGLDLLEEDMLDADDILEEADQVIPIAV